MRTTRLGLLFLLLLSAAMSGAEEAPNCTFGAGALPVETLPAGSLHGDQIPIDHIIVLMQENRSYDHYLGRLRRKSGPPKKASNPDPTGGAPIKPFHQTRYCEVADLDHSWNGTHREWNGGSMDGFAAANAIPEDPTGERAMGYYTKQDLPFYYKLYRTFASGDRFFCALLSQTFPNRYYLLAGTSFGQIRNVIPSDLSGPDYTQRTIFNLLDEATPPVSWKIYYSDLPFGAIFGYVRQNALANLALMTADDATNPLFIDLQAGTLPQVSYVDPSFAGETENDEHPPTSIQKGQAYVAKIVNAVLASPAWDRTALIITYDEHGGFYDHVPPPPACKPDDVPPLLEAGDEPGEFDRYGIRVPFVVISPYARKHFVSHRTYDHTSVLRFVETRFDLPALTRRDANADPLFDLFNFRKPSFKKAPHLPAATIAPGHDECP